MKMKLEPFVEATETPSNPRPMPETKVEVPKVIQFNLSFNQARIFGLAFMVSEMMMTGQDATEVGMGLIKLRHHIDDHREDYIGLRQQLKNAVDTMLAAGSPDE